MQNFGEIGNRERIKCQVQCMVCSSKYDYKLLQSLNLACVCVVCGSVHSLQYGVEEVVWYEYE